MVNFYTNTEYGDTMERTFVGRVELGGLRGLKGGVELGPGLNILLGPNTSGKTSILESISFSIVPNLSDVREGFSKLLVMEASRGSEKHALDSIVCGKDALPCSYLISGSGEEEGYQSKRLCTKIYKKERVESRGIVLSGAVDVLLNPLARKGCVLTISLGAESLGFGISSPSPTPDLCFKEELSLGMVTSGVLPYNHIDSLIGRLKREKPGLLEDFSIRLDGAEYKVDLGSDPWNQMVALVSENSGVPIAFYSIGRGLQRAFQILLLSHVSNILLVDEIESSMHPQLLSQVAVGLAEASRQRQVIVTSQSLEAATMLALAILGEKEPTGDRERLSSALDKHCGSDGSGHPELDERISLVITRRLGSEVKSLTLHGCDALTQIAGSRDARLSYRIL